MKLKQSFGMLVVVLLLVGCGMNESKEARIQKLESQNEQAATQLEKLEARVLALESTTIKRED